MRKGPLIYLCYAIEDQDTVKEVYDKLSRERYNPWMAMKDILPGQDWEQEIHRALREAAFFLVFLSRKFHARDGLYNDEIERALKFSQKKPPDKIFIIPICLEECTIPNELRHLQSLNLFENDGWARLLDTLLRNITPPLPPVAPPEDLIQACVDNECILFAGLGLSAGSGMPTRNEFVEGFLEWAITDKIIEKKFGESLRPSLKQGDTELVVNAVYGQLKNLDKLTRYLENIFLDPSRQLSKTHYLLKDIGFNAVLTSNIDNLLERTFDDFTDPIYTPEDSESFLNSLTKRKFFILKIRGKIEESRGLCVAQEVYKRSIAGNLHFLEVMESLFFSRTLLFIGLSFEGIEDNLEVFNFRGDIPLRHYALVAVSGSDWQAKAELLKKRYGIQVLPYPFSKDHPEVDEFLEKLANETKKLRETRLSTNRSVEETQKSDRVKRIFLENIGTFDKLELDLTPGWNIFLGDNGVGKSTILKAIAVGICGKEAEPYAHRLIKSGKNEASIVIETGRNSYITRIFRKNGGAEIRTAGRILEAEGWLVAGFPPLRTVGWDRPKGPELEEGKSRPTVNDILPLIIGEPDPRMNKLKQWIVNLDYYRLKEKQESNNGGRYEKLLEEFFRVIKHLTEGISLRFKGVDLATRQVMIISDDGEIPIESVSQGTISLMGWIGILLQRIYEVYGDTANPREQFALVLIDEIDAHMHPRWQQSLIPNLVELFPNIQFIATTHSPLIVGNRKPHEVFTLRRDRETGNHVLVEPVKEPFQGWRVDQILTAPLFGLQSTRDLDTQKLLESYTNLAIQDKLSPDEHKELIEAAQILKIRLPSSAEQKEAREAFRILQQNWREQLKHLPPGEQQKILREIKLQMQEMITGSESPR
ncbi:MAG TPA: AAA family ATPase [Candidatus Deferrimicrobium sp.]|nr:AAA family ATPase [Candidatus Kapabacteria bacterium]HLP61521.1 AAA family ATPase [Candidatus Deferrimicrobium sp.]